MDAFTGTIMIWPISRIPDGWLVCQGQTLPMSQYHALFSLIGTTYGGDGVNTFNLPNLGGRMPIGAGNGSGLTPRVLGQNYGAESSALTANNLPAHTHTMSASSTASTSLTQNPAPNWTLGAAASVTIDRNPVTVPVQIYNAATPGTPVPSAPTSGFGSANPAPVQTLPPALCMNFIICTDGIYPTFP